MENQTPKIHRRLEGEVTSDKMTKTVVVKVTTHKRHPKYHKRYSVSKKYKAHDENREYHVGDVVEIEETKPLSKEKKWKVVKKVK
ncbi:MAG: 30S ribosomal protein S17 [Candidatus Doudnabacteria bacterium RIFCSPHIGHO2_02_FULL_48_21]|uniref:Small ribosomal subunit protein uS17 n=1 Tax=Candidatus Doudnabacteria bacterium RIFCSPLOWO2_02_FULL_48_13 TaxID=1817845 RepID=A0A1F5QC46_9BACT|nr:ribosomal protein S17 [uncultured bacterium]OGE76245.1 MAG: 30S ribosomal protein S17 [Candidatus Doudnabacteria bacterium RIFCSPHIGHO2_01_48_18]OGE77516.1 MAG: 30S ribosomal protein S17 [Candidatus Doudnabacteria bacterium RIFCSPHIGHO2_01_FULL_48_180]OGE91657.1 MAG: 30S ribosomal protein S17 [Candidatus Doudnabacteria bacterium RIFCSPHIGHO2_12_FULL_47_25]OGE93351.1 MAG: 30S ribosomal protein S17 [Candidatus Doudnabacteria bacterium RIFCSPHIGHO2_02_FULL_48_21]OGE97435.1 MAG: 30S ribosomal p